MRVAFRSVVAALALMVASVVFAQYGSSGQSSGKSSDNSSTESQIRALDEQQRQAALKQDSSFIEQHTASNFVGVDQMGKEFNRDQAIQDRKAGKVKYDQIELKSTEVRVFGNTAIVTHDATVKGVREGKQFSGDSRATFVWVKEGNDWKLASSSIVPVQETQAAEK